MGWPWVESHGWSEWRKRGRGVGSAIDLEMEIYSTECLLVDLSREEHVYLRRNVWPNSNQASRPLILRAPFSSPPLIEDASPSSCVHTPFCVSSVQPTESTTIETHFYIPTWKNSLCSLRALCQSLDIPHLPQSSGFPKLGWCSGSTTYTDTLLCSCAGCSTLVNKAHTIVLRYFCFINTSQSS